MLNTHKDQFGECERVVAFPACRVAGRAHRGISGVIRATSVARPTAIDTAGTRETGSVRSERDDARCDKSKHGRFYVSSEYNKMIIVKKPLVRGVSVPMPPMMPGS